MAESTFDTLPIDFEGDSHVQEVVGARARPQQKPLRPRRRHRDNHHVQNHNHMYYYPHDDQAQEEASTPTTSTSASTSVSSVPTVPSVSEAGNENRNLVYNMVNYTRLRDLGLDDNRIIVELNLTWFIDNWQANIAGGDEQGAPFVKSPRVKFEGHSWQFVLYPSGKAAQATPVDLKGKRKKHKESEATSSRLFALYVRAWPLEYVEFPSSCELVLEMSNPIPPNRDIGGEASTQTTEGHDPSSISRWLQNQLLTYTPACYGFDEYSSVEELRSKHIMTRDGKVNITARIKLIKRQAR